MSDIRFNSWYHQSGTGGVHQSGLGNVGIGTSATSEKLEVSGSVKVSGPISLSQSPFTQNIQSVSQNYTIDSNYNAMSVGPIGINTNVTVAISTGGTWVIV